MLKIAAILSVLVVLTWAEPGLPASLRYALVIGNNKGVDADGVQPFPDLKHAQTEARRLYDRLLRFGNFDPERTVLLLGATRAEVEEAVKKLVRQKQADLNNLAWANTLFTFFYTGHGLSGRLLLRDGPLNGEELGGLLRSVQADMTIGIFDACYSASLDRIALGEKGIQSTPGLNIFRELPEEVLKAEGSIWLVSSGPLEASYEDEEFGGVFTHFLVEAFEKAPREGPGITLDQIWTYARNHTVSYTSRRGRAQTPEQFVFKLKSTGPLYFSFPVERTASLVLGWGVSGRFALSYAAGQLTELIHKEGGQVKKLAVYPGEASLMQLRDGQAYLLEGLSFSDGSTVVVQDGPEVGAAGRLGARNQKLWSKGTPEQTLTAFTRVASTSFLLGLDYQFRLSPQASLAPQHWPSLSLRLDYAGFTLQAALGYGTKSESFESWSYRADGLGGRLALGASWDLGRVRLSALGGGIFGLLWQSYAGGAGRQEWLLGPLAGAAVLVPLGGGLSLDIRADAGIARTPGAGMDAGALWKLQGGVGVAVLYQMAE